MKRYVMGNRADGVADVVYEDDLEPHSIDGKVKIAIRSGGARCPSIRAMPPRAPASDTAP